MAEVGVTSYRSCRCIESQFYDLEIMCRERVAAGRNEIEYWLIEAEEWGGFDALATGDDGSCYVVQRRVHTKDGWHLQPRQVCG
ncbi:hypothetical protein ACVWXM_006636 [Bradyrhizobium sp. GM7.3]|jgi:hypothetical protein